MRLRPDSTRAKRTPAEIRAGMKHVQAQRELRNQAREARKKLPKTIAAQNLRVLKLSKKVEFSMRGYNSDDQGNETRVFQIKAAKGPDKAFALRFNEGKKEISAEVQGQSFWEEFKPNDFTPQARKAIEEQFSKLQDSQRTSQRILGMNLAKPK